MKWLDLQNFVKECKHKVLKIYILPSFIIVKEPAGVAQTCSVKKLFLEISQKTLIKLQEPLKCMMITISSAKFKDSKAVLILCSETQYGIIE